MNIKKTKAGKLSHYPGNMKAHIRTTKVELKRQLLFIRICDFLNAYVNVYLLRIL